MVYFPATFYDGITSKSTDILIGIDNNHVWHFRVPNGKPSLDLPNPIHFSDVKVQTKIGNAPRIIHLPNKIQIITDEHVAIDSAIKHYNKGRFIFSQFLPVLEKRSFAIACLLVATLAFCSFSYFVALPFATAQIAEIMPDSLAKKLGKEGMKMADSDFLEPTTLSPDKQYELRKHFTRIIDAQPLDLNIKFRSAPDVGANAFALPDGTIVFTDELINLTDDLNELESILAHEIGHVYHKHTLKQMVHQNILSFLMMLAGITTDVSTVGHSLLELSHSRDNETEADTFAELYAEKGYYEPKAFANIMTKMMNSHDMGCLIVEYAVTCSVNEEDSLAKYLSSHPVSEARIQRFLDLQKQTDLLK